MNQIIQENLKQNKKKISKFTIEFSDQIAEIPYGENLMIYNNRSSFKTFLFKRKYQLQFILSFTIATIFIILLFWKLYQNYQQEKVAKDLLNNYQLTTLYSSSGQSNNTNLRTTTNVVENPFVIGMIKIDKINLNYPILSESNDSLLKVSLCRFAGPMPNEIGNLCIAGHNYADDRFFSKLDELDIEDNIEVYGLSGEKQNYRIFRKYEVDPNDLSCTSQNVNNNKVITLLTCNSSNRKKRIVIHAKQI